MAALWDYSNNPGPVSHAPQHWPADSAITPMTNRATLLMMVHPHCPCTRASVGELALLMRQCRGRVAAHVLFLRPINESDGWEKTDLWNSAEAIPDVKVMTDVGGAEARRFGAATSGTVLLYGAAGRLLFEGGITGARGHSGDNAGRDTVVALVKGVGRPQSNSLVFGCELFDPNGGTN